MVSSDDDCKSSSHIGQEPLNTRTVDSIAFLKKHFAIKIMHFRTTYH
jgi:hypothetical protein